MSDLSASSKGPIIATNEQILGKQTTKRDAILTAAGEQFNQYGFQKTSMEDIAQRLGVSRASLSLLFH